MGYVRQRKVYKLVFADPEMEGLEIRACSVPLGGFLDVVDLASMGSVKNMTPEKVKDIDKLFRAFADALKSWNLEEEDGTPVPATLDGLYSQDMEFALTVIMAWLDAIASVPGPLGPKSSGGEQFPEASLPMESL